MSISAILAYGGQVTAIGLLIVFTGLFIIIGCIYLMSALFKMGGKAAENRARPQQGCAHENNCLFHHFLPLPLQLETSGIYPIPVGLVKRAKSSAAGCELERGLYCGGFSQASRAQVKSCR